MNLAAIQLRLPMARIIHKMDKKVASCLAALPALSAVS
jgi:hypothetical protein